ncbi:MAG: SCP2 sterol-binding domain-containing protein, partial [Enterobacterales bacterium]|nr:SCP2 sterol-binding domain-containing protein [Enterobacterales bacterium]
MLTPLLNPLLTGAIETALNRILYRDRALNSARQRLTGKVLGVFVNEINSPIYLVFSESRVDVLGAWEDNTDCSVTTRLSVLPELRDRQQLTALIRSGDLNVEGDIQV